MLVYKRRSLEGVLGGGPLGEGVTGRLALDPSTTSLQLSAQDDTRCFHGHINRARLKTEGCLPHPFIGCFNMKRDEFTPFQAAILFQNETKWPFFASY